VGYEVMAYEMSIPPKQVYSEMRIANLDGSLETTIDYFDPDGERIYRKTTSDKAWHTSPKVQDYRSSKLAFIIMCLSAVGGVTALLIAYVSTPLPFRPLRPLRSIEGVVRNLKPLREEEEKLPARVRRVGNTWHLEPRSIKWLILEFDLERPPGNEELPSQPVELCGTSIHGSMITKARINNDILCGYWYAGVADEGL
jgi:hypothetical protein